jgi:hypothetical protein
MAQDFMKAAELLVEVPSHRKLDGHTRYMIISRFWLNESLQATFTVEKRLSEIRVLGKEVSETLGVKKYGPMFEGSSIPAHSLPGTTAGILKWLQRLYIHLNQKNLDLCVDPALGKIFQFLGIDKPELMSYFLQVVCSVDLGLI